MTSPSSPFSSIDPAPSQHGHWPGCSATSSDWIGTSRRGEVMGRGIIQSGFRAPWIFVAYNRSRTLLLGMLRPCLHLGCLGPCKKDGCNRLSGCGCGLHSCMIPTPEITQPRRKSPYIPDAARYRLNQLADRACIKTKMFEKLRVTGILTPGLEYFGMFIGVP